MRVCLASHSRGFIVEGGKQDPLANVHSAPLLAVRFGEPRTLDMRDLLSDWQRWTPFERVVAATLMLLVVGVPLALALRIAGG
jgi:hypothetical protein